MRVTGSSDLETLYRFRHEVYVNDLGWLPPHPSGLLRDDYDDLSYNYAALDECGSVIGSIRVVPDNPAGLPLERINPLNGYRDGGRRIVELCRFAVARDHRGGPLSAVLMKAGYQRAAMMDATHIVLDTYVGDGEATSLSLKMGYQRVTNEYDDHFQLRELPSVTLACDRRAAERLWDEERPALAQFFRQPDSSIDHG